MHHLDVMARRSGAQVSNAGFPLDLCRHSLEDGPHGLVSLGRSSRHHAGPVPGSGLPARYADPQVLHAALRKGGRPPVGVCEVGVAPVDDDVPGLEQGRQLVQDRIHRFAGAHHQHDAARGAQPRQQLFEGAGPTHALARTQPRHELVGDRLCAVEHGHAEALVGHVEDEVLTHHPQADEADITIRLVHFAPCEPMAHADRYVTFPNRRLFRLPQSVYVTAEVAAHDRQITSVVDHGGGVVIVTQDRAGSIILGLSKTIDHARLEVGVMIAHRTGAQPIRVARRGVQVMVTLPTTQ